MMLKKNYESVLKALDRVEILKAQFAEQATESQQRLTEAQLNYQLQLDEVIGESILLSPFSFFSHLLISPFFFDFC
jgi:hypothetical protein